MSAYTDQERVEGYLNRELTSTEAVSIEYIISFVSEFINIQTNRKWNDLGAEEPIEETRLYDGGGHRELFVDDFISLSEIRLLDSLGSLSLTIDDSDDYALYPLNSEVKQSIYLKSDIFPSYPATVEIDAVFTSGDVPEDIVFAATSFAGLFCKKGVATEKGFKKESIEGYAYEVMGSGDFEDEVAAIMNKITGRRKIIF